VAAEIAHEMLGNKKNRSVMVMCGRGNNGGDGYVVARYLLAWGHRVRVCALTPIDEVHGDAHVHLDVLLAMQADVRPVLDTTELAAAARRFSHTHLIVDAILGTGVKGEVHGIAAEAIQIINSGNVPVLAVDIPSGLDANTGKPLGMAVEATRTATCHAPKAGFRQRNAAKYTGEVSVVDIGIPREVVRAVLRPPKANKNAMRASELR
ncbi:MAG: NAD(P)H-hydrate epimerase, partial [Candidatus Hydrogenedentes bacterium]|nr:NAD(P)H-hydrate epimerase [Candidatus Hydrogenedentota bacterium]